MRTSAAITAPRTPSALSNRCTTLRNPPTLCSCTKTPFFISRTNHSVYNRRDSCVLRATSSDNRKPHQRLNLAYITAPITLDFLLEPCILQHAPFSIHTMPGKCLGDSQSPGTVFYVDSLARVYGAVLCDCMLVLHLTVCRIRVIPSLKGTVLRDR